LFCTRSLHRSLAFQTASSNPGSLSVSSRKRKVWVV
jgi:hypothetical protein